ncbi:MAG: hypothetical protein H7Y13_10595 [Sphingobacteriaceae bacterium]|nr:hypothetical protein [Sphingobacteriaceae bacterium]
MIRKKSIRVTLASVLLLCFSIAVLPLDIFHDHTSEQTTCGTTAKHSSCQHKLHISEKTSYCFVCTAHIDKAFDLAYSSPSSVTQSFTTLSFKLLSTDYTSETFLFFLRGPPSRLS